MATGKILEHLKLGKIAHLPFWSAPPAISRPLLNKYSSGLHQNFLEIGPAYLSGLKDLDMNFLKDTTSPYLYNILQSQVQKNISNKTKGIQIPLNFDDKQSYKRIGMVCPYVIFGMQIEQRLNQHPLEGNIQLTRNRFFATPELSLNYFNRIREDQISGFQCFFVYLNKQKKQKYSFMINFQAEIGTQQFFVIDIQNVLHQQGDNNNAKQ